MLARNCEKQRLDMNVPHGYASMLSLSRIFSSTPTTQCTGEIKVDKKTKDKTNLTRLEAGKLRNVGKFYSHLLHTGI